MKKSTAPKEYWPCVAEDLTVISRRVGATEVCRWYVICVIGLGVMSALAHTIVVPTQPVSEFADTEVSTNIAIRTGRTISREVEIHIQLAGTPTNCLEVAFGRDANANGVLDAEETETMYGWRSGRYFIENVKGWERIESEADTNAVQCGVIDIQIKNNADIIPRRFAATCGGKAAFADFSKHPPPDWLFREGWNMVRVTRRGAGIPSEWVRCKFDYRFFIMSLR